MEEFLKKIIFAENNRTGAQKRVIFGPIFGVKAFHAHKIDTTCKKSVF